MIPTEIEIVFILFLILASATMAAFLYLRTQFFKRFYGFLALLALGIFLSLLHNLIYGLTNFEEPITFTLALLAIGTFLVMLVIWLIAGALKLARRVSRSLSQGSG